MSKGTKILLVIMFLNAGFGAFAYGGLGIATTINGFALGVALFTGIVESKTKHLEKQNKRISKEIRAKALAGFIRAKH